MKSNLYVLTTGGTAGHLFPATAVAQCLRERGHQAILITDDRGAKLTDKALWHDLYSVKAAGLKGHGWRRKIKAGLALGQGVGQAWRLLGRLQPKAVIGFGGYAAFPTVVAAYLRRIPVIIHEQNAIPGRANRLFKKIAYTVALGLPLENINWGPRAIVTGNPVRPAFKVINKNKFKESTDQKFIILVLGGSQGAQIFSQVLPEALKLLPDSVRFRLRIYQQCRSELFDETQKAYAELGVDVDLAPYFTDVAKLFDQAHLVISRSGASTIAELFVSGKPAILIPYPFASDDHQSANARYYVTKGGGVMIQQRHLTPELLAAAIQEWLLPPERWQKIVTQIRQNSIPDADQQLTDLIESVI